MDNIVVVLTAELSGLRDKIDAAIKHVAAGVNTLNEDQQAELRGMVAQIENEAARTRITIEDLVSGAETKTEGIIAKVEGVFEEAKIKVEGFLGIEPKPSAADLDAVAADHAAAEATAIPPAVATDEPAPAA